MKEFFEAFDDMQEEAAAESEQKFRHRGLCRICKFFNVAPPQDNEDEATWEWFSENYPKFPIPLESRRVQANVSQMFSAMIKTEAWDTYWHVFEERRHHLLALFVPSKGHGVFVLHNCWHLPAVSGHTRLVRTAKTGDKGIIFESLEAFLESLRQGGLSP